MAKINIRRDKNWRRRCKWTLVTLGAVALWVYNGTDMWVERAPACPAERARAPAPPSCAPCPAAPSSLPAGDPLATLDPRLGRWDAARAFKLFDAAAVGADYTKLSSARKVCLATQSSIERLHELLRIATHWSGPLSVAVYVAADELRFLRGFAIWLLRCQPSVYKRLALHVAMPAERPAYHGPVPGWATDCSAKPLPKDERSNETKKWRVRAPYPQNHMRNMARRNCHTPYVFLVDIDIIPSMYMAESLEKFLSSEIKCYRCAYVVPTYELDRRVATFPANKSELLRLSRNKLAVPFHKKVFIYNQYASNFSRWEATGGNESLEAHVSHDVTNFELLYEPFYVAPDTVPAHDERFVGYGFTRNTQQAAENDCAAEELTDPQDCADPQDNELEVQEDNNIDLEQACPELSGQIIGGRASSINRHPYQVSMVINGNSFCGGFIISPDYVLTAAHCVQNTSPARLRLRVGSTRRDTGGRIVQVSNITVHPQYGRPRFDNDIAVLRLAQPLVLTPSVRPIRLPRPGQPVPLVRLTVTGWGLTAPRGRRIPRTMMEAQVPVVPHWLCRLSYGDSLTNNMFCGGHFLIGGVSSCQVYEMFLMGYKFKVLSPIFTIHWGLQSRRHRPLWRERQNQANRKLFETFKRELYVRAKLTSGRRRKAALRSAKLARDRSLTAPMRSVKLSSGRRLKVPMRPHNRYRKDPLHLIFKKGQQPKKI